MWNLDYIICYCIDTNQCPIQLHACLIVKLIQFGICNDSVNNILLQSPSLQSLKSLTMLHLEANGLTELPDGKLH